MFFRKKVKFFLGSALLPVFALSQHPDFRMIDSLEKILPAVQGIKKVNCLNALGEQYWWPPKVNTDSIYYFAGLAMKESEKINDDEGKATATLLFGVAELYKRNFVTSGKYLSDALRVFEKNESSFGLGWGNVWLGQALYSQNRFEASLSCYYKSLLYLDEAGYFEAEGKAWTWMAYIYATLGNYDSSLFYCSKSLLLRQKMSDHVCVTASYANIGQLYKSVGAYDEALDYFRQGFNYANTHGVDIYTADWIYFEPVGVIYRLMNFPDSSYFYLQKALKLDPDNETTRMSFGETLLMQNQVDSALRIFLEPVDQFRSGNDNWDLMRVAMDLAKVYERKKNIKTALRFANESLSLARSGKARHFILDGYMILSRLYRQAAMVDSAYYFLNQYTGLRDSILTSQFIWKLTNYKNQAEYKKKIDQLAALDTENKAKEKELEQKSLSQRVLLIFLFIAATSGFFIYKSLTLKRKNEKLENLNRQSALQKHVTDLEMQALRAQMSPHFIFNCLSSINRFILKNETDAASGYLTKFSRLIRMVLMNSQKPSICLEDELETLRLYQDMEALRFKNSFDYKISFLNSIDVSNIFIPPMLMQPFAENAIWHGLMHKEGQGHLEIELHHDDKFLFCTVTDNGIGRQKASDLKSKSAEKHKSMGLQITRERLELMQKDQDYKTSFAIEDLYDETGKPAGTRVNLSITLRNKVEMVS